jgi:4-hydroxy-2-oxoheptanedioate aldolase
VDTFLGWMRYPPEGNRAAFSNVIAEYKPGAGKESNQFLNDQTMLVIQVESPEAVEAIGEIVEGGGVDVVEVGRADLSQSFGVPGQRRHPLVLEAIDKIVAASKKWNVAVGAGCDSREDAEDLIGRGIRYLMGPGSDFGILNRGYKEGNQMLRALVQAAQPSAPDAASAANRKAN